jgi:hypothetical protein
LRGPRSACRRQLHPGEALHEAPDRFEPIDFRSDKCQQCGRRLDPVGIESKGERDMEETKGKSAPSKAAGTKKHAGGCHCGAVRFEVELDLGAGGSRCNCTICTKIAPTGAIVKPGAFALRSGEESLSEYRWGAKIAGRFFCKRCGVHCFGRGHLDVLGGDFVSINLNCLDEVDLAELKIVYWDGRHDNWQAGSRSTPWPTFTGAST